jgi:hypothetical protein
METVEKLTTKKLKELSPMQIFASGTTYNTTIHGGVLLRWVAIRGGMGDWFIKFHDASNTEDWIKESGIILLDTNFIQKLVPCTGGALTKYRLS